MTIPTLTTPRLVLRSFEVADAPVLHRILSEPDILRYFPSTDPPPLDRVERFIARQLAHWDDRGYGWWAVQPEGHPELVGWNGLQYLPETDEIEIGYLLSRAFWGCGLATEGARAGVRFGFQALGLDRIVGIVHPENLASQRVLQKAGLIFTREAEYFGMAVYRYEVTRDAWETLRRL